MPKLKPTMTPLEEQTAAEIKKEYGLLLSLPMVSDYLKCSRQTAAKWLGDIDAVRVGGRKMFQASDIARKIEAGRERALTR